MNLIKHKHERKHLRSCNCRVPRVQYAREQRNVPYVAYTATLGFSWIHHILLPVTIDEAFLELTDLIIDHFTEFGRTIKAQVLQYTGIPVSVGIAPTKSLIKIANEVVKKDPTYGGVLDLTNLSDPDIDEVLAKVDIED